MEENHKTPKVCIEKLMPVRDTLDVFKGKWKIQIISVLIYFEKCGFKELQDLVIGITPKMLSKELKDLETNLLITRTVSDTRPVTVTYQITDYGKTCIPMIKAMYEWGEKHRETIKESFSSSKS